MPEAFWSEYNPITLPKPTELTARRQNLKTRFPTVSTPRARCLSAGGPPPSNLLGLLKATGGCCSCSTAVREDLLLTLALFEASVQQSTEGGFANCKHRDSPQSQQSVRLQQGFD